RCRPARRRRGEPPLSPGLRLALEAPEDHAVDPGRLVAALCAAIENAGGRGRRGAEESGLARGGGRGAGGRLAGDERVDAEHVVIAAGCWSIRLDGIPPDAALPLRP